MMRDKQIEEMARDICHLPRTCDECEVGAINGYRCQSKKYAERAVDKGYRKASDVAREIFEEIDDIRLEHSYGEIDGNELNVKLFNLKKKYESEGEG